MMKQPRDFMRERSQQVALDMVKTTDEIIDQIRPLLAGHNPTTQGAVIAELLGILLGGYAPALRHEICDATVEIAWRMMELHDGWKGKK
jgi:hypothetical protein